MTRLSIPWCSRRDLVVFLAGLIIGCATCWLAVKVIAPSVSEPTSVKKLAGAEGTVATLPTPVVQVFTDCPGMSAESVEKTITNHVKRWVKQAPGVVQIESKSEKGASLITVYFRADVDSETALTVTNEMAMGALLTLPPDTVPPIVLPCPDSGPREVGDILKLLGR